MARTMRRQMSPQKYTRKVRCANKDLEVICKDFAPKVKSTVTASWEEAYEKTFKASLTKTNEKYDKVLMKMFRTPFTPSTIKLPDDYYTYINYKWIAAQNAYVKKSNKYYVQVDQFRIAQEKVYRDLIEITKDHIKANHTATAKQLSNVYQSFLRLDESAAARNVKKIMTEIDTYIANDDLIPFLAYINLNEVVSWACPIVWGIQADDKNSAIYRIYIVPGQVTLYDQDLYTDVSKKDSAENAKYKRMIKYEYLKYINELFTACLGKNHGLKANDVFEVEKEILTMQDCDKIKNDSEEFYNIVTAHDALAKYGFDWAKFSNRIGYTYVPDKIIVSSLNYLSCAMKLMQDNWKTPKWRTYWLYIYYRQLIRFHGKWREIYFKFNENIIQGQTVIFPRELYPVFGVAACFNTLITNEYIKKNSRPHYIEYMRNMAEDMKIVFKRIVKRNTWLSPQTKKYALLKLDHMKLIIGTPEKMRDDAILDYTADDPWENLHTLSIWRAIECTKLDGKPVLDIPAIDWQAFKLVGYQSYIVNAFYTPTMNSIYIPSAYLQKPFIDLDERGIEYNLAHVGFTLGHEMSHSLDDLGSQYDYKGNLKNWWTAKDRVMFNKKVDDVVKQYEEFAARDGIKMDASLSTGENLADISGLAICQEYLRDFQDKNEDIVPIRSLSFQAFYCYYAIQAQQQISKRAIKAQTKTNPHPLDKYRTNCTLSRLALFKSIYNIKEGDGMYWHNNDTIW